MSLTVILCGWTGLQDGHRRRPGGSLEILTTDLSVFEEDLSVGVDTLSNTVKPERGHKELKFSL